MKEPRQANCSFITYFPGQTRSAVFSLKNKREKTTSKDSKEAFSVPFTAEMLSELRHTWCSPGAVAQHCVSPGALSGLSPQTMALLPRWVWHLWGCLIPHSLLPSGMLPGLSACAVALNRNWVLLKENIPRFWSWQGRSWSPSTQSQCTAES